MGSLTLLIVVLASVMLSVYCQDTALNLEVTPSSSRHFIRKGGGIKITCDYRTNQDVQLKWVTPAGFSGNRSMGFVKNSLVIYNEKTTPKTILGYRAELDIVNHQVPGEYACVVYSKDSTTALSKYPIQFHIVTEEVEEAMFYRENKSLTVSCSISVPIGIVQSPVWKRNGTKVEDIKQEKGGEFQPNGSNLTVLDVMRIDAALYTAEYPIKVEEDNQVYSYDCNVAINADPLVLEFEKSKNLIEEENLELHCRVLGYPLPDIFWFKDNKPLENSSTRITKRKYDGVPDATLIIKGVEFDDAGEYKCLAITEKYSNSSKTITVRVKGKFAALWPFLGIVGEVIVLCTIIFIYERRRSRQAEQEEANQDEPEPVKKGNVRNRRNQK